MNALTDNYTLQDRGEKDRYAAYLHSMDQIVVEKVASASAFFDPAPGGTIVDVGMGSGTSSGILALLFPGVKIIGIDINPKMVGIAAEKNALPNLEFRIEDGEKLSSFRKNLVTGFFNCSSLHHITSFNGYEPSHAFNALKKQAEILKSGGVLVVRDFVKPDEKMVILELSGIPGKERPGDADLLVSFSKEARSLAKPDEKGFSLKEMPSGKKGSRRFLLHYHDALEFIRRKDYYSNWEIELREEYSYFTRKEFEDIFTSLGLRIIISAHIYNPWIINNRYRNQFSLYDLNLNDIGFPPTNYIIAGEKVRNKGTRIHTVRYLPENNNSFLKYSHFKNRNTNEVFDVVQRPNSVFDIIPYIVKEDGADIIAKHGYPRPVAMVNTDSPIIDQKFYSGYITEGITASKTDTIGNVIEARTGLNKGSIASVEKALKFYTSPGGINENVESLYVGLKRMPGKWNNNVFSGFSETGKLRKFDAVQLLRTAQTGALMEGRLELNIYNLLRKLKIPFPEWLGEKIIPEEAEITAGSLASLLDVSEKLFDPTERSADYLSRHRARFSEIGVTDSSNTLEYVMPADKSINTLVYLPVASCNGKIYLGLETRHLPVPQLHEGNSFILVAPALRLPKEIKNYKDLEKFILELKIGRTRITKYSKLGEKYFPSVGITPEQVYPYVVTFKEISDEFSWIELDELYDNMEILRDGHLLLSIVRLKHALSCTGSKS